VSLRERRERGRGKGKGREREREKGCEGKLFEIIFFLPETL